MSQVDEALAIAVALTCIPFGLLWLMAAEWINDRMFGDNNVTLAFVVTGPFVLFGWVAYFAVKATA